MSLQKELEDVLIQYNEAYRLGEPLISDEEYDELIDHLKSNYPDSHILKKGVVESVISRKQPIPLRIASLEKRKQLKKS
jgi:NAD-dependent DNA ligase